MEPPIKDDEGDEEDNDHIKIDVIGLPASKEYLAKVLQEEENRIWSDVSWPSSFADVLQRSCEMAKLKTKLTGDAFRAT